MSQNKIRVLPCGLGKLGSMLVAALLLDDSFEVLSYALEDVGVTDESRVIDGHYMTLVKEAGIWNTLLPRIKEEFPDLIILEASCPAAVNDNVKTFCHFNIPSLICTTGGDRDMLEATINASEVPAIIAPNLAAPIVWLLETLAAGAENAPGLLANWRVIKTESHQLGKKDFSGTADLFGKRVFTPLGAKDVDVKNYIKITADSSHDLPSLLRAPDSANIAIRSRLSQMMWGVPKEHLDGHGWHEYILTAPDDSISIKVGHNVNGRTPYIPGAIQALKFLHQTRIAGYTGVFTVPNVIFNQ